MHFHSEIIEKFPVRKKGEQKDGFLKYATAKAQEMGYTAKVEDIKNNRNLIVGNPESAKVVFTAHYDTPAVMPFPNFITPRNILIYILYQIIPVGCIILAGVLAVMLCQAVFGITEFEQLYAIFMVCYFGCLMLLLFGPANKNNYNDNTSGIAALLCIMQKLPREARDKVAFIFFDNEEKHMQGSANYAKQHKEVKQNTLIVNLDCVGDGKHLFCFAKKGARAHALYPLLTESVISGEDYSVAHVNSATSVYPSDQASFQCGTAICACKKAPVIGYYMDRIHTRRDTICDLKNLDFLADRLSAFAEKL